MFFWLGWLLQQKLLFPLKIDCREDEEEKIISF
jgi:hypothetical protein